MPSPVAQVGRKTVLVLGMHRSGTSALAGALIAAGGRGPTASMPGSATNPVGYHESMMLYERHKQILAAAGSDWTDWRPFTSLKTHVKEDQETDLIKDFTSEFGAEGWAVFKDPRLCKLLGIWKPVFSHHRLTPCPIHILRHPREVAASLARRNRMLEAESLMLWLSHTLEAESATRGQRRIFVSFADVLCAPEVILTRLCKVFDLSPFRPARYDVDPVLRNHRVGSEAKLPEPVAKVFEILNRWVALGESASDYPALDRKLALLIALAGTTPAKGGILKASVGLRKLSYMAKNTTTAST